MMNFVCYLFIFLSIFQTQVTSRPIPRKTLSFGGKVIIQIKLEKWPPKAFAIVAIGNPPVEATLHIDTGVDLTWVQREPSIGYDPLASSSFSFRSCAGFKRGVLTPSKRRREQCNYKIRLADNATYLGKIGQDTFAFNTGDMGTGVLENVLFGFGRTDNGRQLGTGTFGLNMDELSIINRSVTSQFSICLGNFNTIGSEKNLLILGEDAVLEGMEVPFYEKSYNYHTKITSIAVNGNVLDIPNLFSDIEAIVDTGTSSLLSLVPNAYTFFSEILDELISDTRYENPYDPKDRTLCYIGKIPKDARIVVSLILGKVTMSFFPSKLFIQVDNNIYCSAVNEMPGNLNVNVIGIAAFQGYNVGFNIPNKKLHLKSVECNKLYDDVKDELYLPTT